MQALAVVGGGALFRKDTADPSTPLRSAQDDILFFLIPQSVRPMPITEPAKKELSP